MSKPAAALALTLALGLAGAALAQTAAPAGGPNGLVFVRGALTAVSADGLKVRGADGMETALGLAPSFSVVATRPIAKDQIKPGDFVASANLEQGQGVGRSIEMRLFEPGQKGGEGNRAMTQPGALPGQMMTNATVTKVASTSAGLELDVQYPGGVRHLVVPPEVTIIAAYPVDPSVLKPGAPVMVVAVRAPDGALRANRIQIEAASER